MKRPADYLGEAKSLTQEGAAVCLDIGTPKAAAPEEPTGSVLARMGKEIYELPQRYYSPIAVLRGHTLRLKPERFIKTSEDQEGYDLMADSLPEINELRMPEAVALDYTNWVIENWGPYENPDGSCVFPSLSGAQKRGLTLKVFLESFRLKGGQ